MEKETFAKRLQKALDYKNWNQSDLEKKLNGHTPKIDKTLISKYLSGLTLARQNRLSLLADILDVSEPWLMGYNVPMERTNSLDKNESKIKFKFPILGLVKAGYDYFAEENCIGYITLDKDVSDIGNYFALKVTGDSMQPILYENDLVVVHKQDDIENGQVAIILVDGEEATIKKVLKFDDHIELHAFNSYYPPRILKKNDDFKIIGKVVEARISRVFE